LTNYILLEEIKRSNDGNLTNIYKELKKLSKKEPSLNARGKPYKLSKKDFIYKMEKRNNPLRGMKTTKDLRGRVTLQIRPQSDSKDIYSLLRVNMKRMKRWIIENLTSSKKASLSINVDYFKSDSEGDITDEINVWHENKVEILMRQNQVDSFITNQIESLRVRMDEYQKRGSGWKVKGIKVIGVSLFKYRPVRSGKFMELPPQIKNKKACINIKNDDDKCFLYAVACALFYEELQDKKHSERVNQYKPFLDRLKYDGLKFPIEMNDVEKFERWNDVKVYVYGYGFEKDNVQLFPIFKSLFTPTDKSRVVDLLMIGDRKVNHFCWIKDMSRLFAGGSKNEHKKFYCRNCVHGFTSEDGLHKHMELGCDDHKPTAIKMPEDDAQLYFKNYKNTLKCPFVVYADFESILKPVNSACPSHERSFTTSYQLHEPISYAYVIMHHDKVYKKTMHVGSDCVEKFLLEIQADSREIVSKVKENVPMTMTPCDWKKFHRATECHICNRELGDDKVKDHDHETGKFRGAAHNSCNINFNLKFFKLPVFIHNLKGYDSHLLLSKIGQLGGRIDCIPMNSEKYLSFTWNDIVFKDSCQFMAASLDSLVKNLKKDDLHVTMEHFKNYDEKAKDLITRKGVFPYDWFDSAEKLNDVCLPSKDDFYSRLSDEHITIDEYERANKVWETFSCKTFKDYHDLYLMTDVLLLADVFQNFRKFCINTYGKIDPAYYYSLPGFSWDACLKKSDVKLDLLSDVDMHLFIEKGIRGGISMISHRYAKSNNKYMHDYDKTKESSYNIYLDANNLYGWAMSQYLPTSKFEWCDESFCEKRLMSLSDEGMHGYIFEVDLEYPSYLHDLHNDYPLAPENICVHDDMLSPFAKDLKNKLNISSDTVGKLVPNLNNKHHYIVHYRNLKLYLSLGLKVTKVHRALKFVQAPWMKPFISMNTDLRKNAKSAFEKDLFKLMNNSVFGKTMENVRNHIDFRLLTKWEGEEHKDPLLKLIAKPQFNSMVDFNEHLVGVHLNKKIIELNKPIYVGFSILDLSKTLMYDFHYNHIMKKYGRDKIKLLFTDTDSLCYNVKTDNIYEDMLKNKDLYDTSEYSKGHVLYDSTESNNSKVIGKFKDESCTHVIREFVGLRPKMYSFTSEATEKKVCKGVKRYVIKKHITFDEYKQCLMNSTQTSKEMNTIRSSKHELSSISINKIALSSFDNKRYLLDSINSLSYGHYLICK
jgi:hypothetical protein